MRLMVLFNIIVVNGFRFSDHGMNMLTKELKSNIDGRRLNPKSVEEKWIVQPLDHFNPNEKRTWKMRYFFDDKFWRMKGPIYIFVCGEVKASAVFLRKTIIYELAKETYGAMVAAEHRYYGKSKPLPVKAPLEKNLKYLSSRQAVGDLNNLVKHVKASKPWFKNSKVVVVGGSYGGSLATWLRMLYPGSVTAAVAFSPPLLAKKNCVEALETVAEDYKKYEHDVCYDIIEDSFKKYKKKLKTQKGIERLKVCEHICNFTDMSRIENQQMFLEDQISMFLETAQFYGFLAIKDHCIELVSNFIRSDVDGRRYWRKDSKCFDYDFKKYINLKPLNLPWIYQSCNEFGQFPTTDSPDHPFSNSVPLEFYVKICSGIFGPKFNEARIDEGVERTNQMYGGLKPNATKVLFINGEMDPWSSLSVLDGRPGLPVKIIPRGTHCSGMILNANDDHDVVGTRIGAINMVKKWIKWKQ